MFGLCLLGALMRMLVGPGDIHIAANVFSPGNDHFQDVIPQTVLDAASSDFRTRAASRDPRAGPLRATDSAGPASMRHHNILGLPERCGYPVTGIYRDPSHVDRGGAQRLFDGSKVLIHNFVGRSPVSRYQHGGSHPTISHYIPAYPGSFFLFAGQPSCGGRRLRQVRLMCQMEGVDLSVFLFPRTGVVRVLEVDPILWTGFRHS